MSSSKARAVPRPRLSLVVVVDAAIALVAREGPHALTMRRVGRELGVEAMSLYRYVPSLDALLDQVVDRVVDDMLDTVESELGEADDWRAFLTVQAHGLRRLALAQPQLFPLIATHPTAARWVRPPLRSLRWIEQFLSGLLQRGFGEQGAAAAYRSYTSFLLGHLLLEVGARGVSVGPLDESLDGDVAPPSRQDSQQQLGEAFPAVARLADGLAEAHPDEEFRASLTTLLDHLEHLNGLPSPTSLG